MGYFTINPFMGDGIFAASWLDAQPACYESEGLRAVHFANPIIIKMDGRKNTGIVMKPAEG